MKNDKHCALRVLVFKEWKRKGYSLFQSMNRVIVISVLTVMYLYSLPVVAQEAKNDTIEINSQIDLDEIEVSAQRSPAILSQVARIVSVIERKEIEASPAQSVQDLLEYIAGVDVRQRGAGGVQADVSIRGGTFDQTLILLNGINITDPQTGHHNLNLPVSINQIQRIEVLEGPAARVYGPNAFSGAINIVTSKTKGKSLNAAISAGSFGFFDANAAGSFTTGKLSHTLAANHKKSDGYIENTDFKISNLYYSNQFVAAKGEFDFQLGISGKGFGANSFYTPKYPNQYEETNTLFSSAKWEGKGKLHITPVVYYRRHQDRFELFRSNPASWYKNHNYHLTNVYGGNLNSWFKWIAGKSAIGFEYRSENILSNVLGDVMDKPVSVPGENAEFTKSKSRAFISGFLEHSYYGERWSATFGIMSNYIGSISKSLNFFPGIDVGYNLAPTVKLYASYNKSLRLPTFTDLFYAGPTNIGNPDLNPEQSQTIEGGLKWNGQFFKGNIVVFYRQGKDIIDWVKYPEDEKWQPQNLTLVNNFGTEFQLRFFPQKKFGGKLPEQVRISYLNNNLDKIETELISNYVLDNLRHKFTASVQQRIIKNIRLDLRFTFQDREGTYTEYINTQAGNEVAYKPFWLVDGKLIYTFKNTNVFLSANNIFNLKYNDIGNVIQPGRWIKAGISYQLEFE